MCVIYKNISGNNIVNLIEVEGVFQDTISLINNNGLPV